ncbi:Jag N-terminal domain-containing protein [Helicobacter sp. 23-1048]
MKKITAKTLQDALLLASEEFKCSVVDLEYEVAQNPSAGILGIGRKDAVIIVDYKKGYDETNSEQDTPKQDSGDFTYAKKANAPQPQNTKQSSQAPQKSTRAYPNTSNAQKNISTKERYESTYEDFNDSLWGDTSWGEPEGDYTSANHSKHKTQSAFQATQDSKDYNVSSSTSVANTPKIKEIDEKAMVSDVERELKELFSYLPFEIDHIKVVFMNDELCITIDGRDCALLIGEKGYRYKALSYLLFNWINPKYGVTVRLEVAEFLKNQEQMIDVYLEGIIEQVNATSKAQTKPLDGILAYIALGKLREIFPQKYVSFRLTDEGEKYIIINDFKKS